MPDHSDIINWQEAMQQVGDDEAFLRELLADLRTELQTQLTTIEGIIQVRRIRYPYISVPSILSPKLLVAVSMGVALFSLALIAF